jgi:hypothetical protein
LGIPEMKWNDYLMNAWNKVANSGPISNIADKTYKGPQFKEKPIVTYEKPKGQPYNGYHNKGFIKVVQGPQQKRTLNHETAHFNYRNMYNSLEPLGSDAQNWQPLMGIEGFDQKVKQHDPGAYNYINKMLQHPIYKDYVDVPNEFYAYYANLDQDPELRKYY